MPALPASTDRSPEHHAPRSVGVVGCGLLGTSVGMALAAAGMEALLSDNDAGAISTAVSQGAGRPWGDGESVDLLVVAVPPAATARTAVALLRDGRAVWATDVASVKRVVQEEVDAAEDVASRFCGGHPLAGRERGGAVHAREDLFEGRPWVVAPSPTTSPEAAAATTWLATVVGAQVKRLGAAEHDVAVALVSHLPQLVASLLAARLVDADDATLALAGTGLRDTLRIAGSDPALWGGIVAHNADAVAAQLVTLRSDVDGLLAVLGTDGATPEDAPAAAGRVGDLVARGRAGRSRLPGKHGAAQRDLAVVTVVVDDRPGRLAALLAAASDAGANVEDLTIDHTPGRARGVVELLVDPQQATHLADALRRSGWSVPPGESRPGLPLG